MKYQGSKRLWVRHLLPIMLPERKAGQWWVEPFVGGANMIDQIENPRLGSDVHPELIALLKAVQRGWVPPTEISEEAYRLVKDLPHYYPDHLVGFVGFPCSFGGKWWAGYGRSKSENLALEGSNSLVKQAARLQGIQFECCSYDQLDIPTNSLIYCDPPYQGTSKYRGGFDHDRFWDWCRQQVAVGHTVFISETQAPDDFECLFEQEATTPMNHVTGTRKTRVERLFRGRK